MKLMIKKFALLFSACVVMFLISGCASRSANKDTLVILSPNGRDIQAEFERAFLAKRPGAAIQWLDQGGSSTALRFADAQFEKQTDKDKGIGIDLFFGGGPESFLELEDRDLLQRLPENYGVPATLNGVPLRGRQNTWVASCLSGFGILYNKELVARDHLPTPKTWGDLANPAYRDRIALADPRKSGSAYAAYEIILQTNGWEEGWRILLEAAANARTFIDSSSILLQNVANGEAVAVPAIDFYARAAIEQAGANKLGYVEPEGQRVVTPDPIGLLRGAPNKKLALDFIKFVLSPEGQKIWMLRKGAPGGPVQSTLFRSPALPAAYTPIPADSTITSDPFLVKNTRPYDAHKATVRRHVLSDLLGAVLIDNHDALRKAKPASLQKYIPAGESQVQSLAKEWSNAVRRQKQITTWRQEAARVFSE